MPSRLILLTLKYINKMELQPVYLSEDQKRELLNGLKEDLKAAEAKVKSIKDLINALTTQPQLTLMSNQHINGTASIIKPYNKNWSWTSKIIYVLETNKKCQTTRQILELIKQLEPDLNDRQSLSSISGTISTKVKEDNLLDRYKDGTEFYMGLKEWFHSKGRVKDEFRH